MVTGTSVQKRAGDEPYPEQPEQAPSGADLPRAALRRLSLCRFRSYEALDVALTPEPAVLFGANGAGKTNVLEAISLLTPGRGLRGAKFTAVTRQAGDGGGAGGGAGWSVSAVLHPDRPEDGEPVKLGTGLANGEKRVVRINEAAAAPADLGDWLRVMWLTPAMDRLFTESASGRRRFLDRLVLALDPKHASRALAYERAMRQRLHLLKEGRQEPAWLDGLEDTMVTCGTAMAAARMDLVQRLQMAVDAQAAALDAHFPASVLGLSGDVEQSCAMGDVEAAAEAFRAQLAASRTRDRFAQRTTMGPHRTDLLVRHRAKKMPAAECSTGEQKALLIGLVLAQTRLLREAEGPGAPVLLLDEVTAHLDATRRGVLFDAICQMQVQVFMTGTERSVFEGLSGRAQFFHVAGGRLTPVPE